MDWTASNIWKASVEDKAIPTRHYEYILRVNQSNWGDERKRLH